MQAVGAFGEQADGDVGAELVQGAGVAAGLGGAGGAVEVAPGRSGGGGGALM